MDHSIAHLMEYSSNPFEIKTIESNFTHLEKVNSFLKGEIHMHNKEQQEQARELHILKVQVHQTLEELTPLYQLKKTVKAALTTPEGKTDILQGALHLTSNWLAHNNLLTLFQKPIKKVVSNLVLNLLNKLSPNKNNKT